MQDTFIVQPSAQSSQHDFDFLAGEWNVKNRRLVKEQWIEFSSVIHMRITLNGMGNVENYYAVFDGAAFEGQAVRLFNPVTRLWTIYWMDSNNMLMDATPVSGSFHDGVGKFYAAVIRNNNPAIMLYQWDVTNKDQPKWSQAFSFDNGIQWEWDWEMLLTKIK